MKLLYKINKNFISDMSNESKYKGLLCVYQKPCFAICTNPSCFKPGIICQNGYKTKGQCCLFHDSCSKLKWSEVQALVYNNPNLNTPQMLQIQSKIDGMFLKLLQKIESQHKKFRLWVRTNGHSMEVMKFIKKLSQNNFTQLNGNYLNPILNQLGSITKIQLPTFEQQEMSTLEEGIILMIEKISQLYFKPIAKRPIQLITSPVLISNQKKKQLPLSEIISDMSSLQQFFNNKISSVKLLYRASEDAFSIKQFHKKCDGQTNTLVLIHTEYGKIIGGFTPLVWSSSQKQWTSDKSYNSFIFSVSTQQKFNLTLAQFAIANNADKGPIFGCCDICLVDRGNKERCNAQFPISYNNNKYTRCPETSIAFTGHPKGQFTLKEWEVFKLQF